MDYDKIDQPLPPLTKKEVIKRVEFMINNCKNKDTVVSLKNVLIYIKRLKE